ncbi:MAG: sugar porter family MFS transporter [Bacteroidales bacterium]|nr:sugar porter family MFS transporter [Bacteroidales bacterium]MBQ9530218.1 sugar porter family MFS transporter [Bacteroidales bacterium]
MKQKLSAYVIFLSVVAAIGGILFGYDTAVISGTTEIVKTQFGLSTGMEGWYVGCALIGSIIGVLVAGMLSDFLGRKKTMLIAALMFSVSAIGCAVCADFTQLVIYRIIGGFGIGIVSIVSPIYISEVSPARVRGTMVSFYQLFITIGFLLAYLVNFFILKGAALDSGDPALGVRMFNNEYWRGMLGCETIPDLLFLIVIFFIPESPRWLIVKGQDSRALAIMRRIYSSDSEAEAGLAQTKESIAGEVKTEWKALLEPGILKAVLVGSAIAILGQFMGVNAVLYYGPKIFSDAGFSDPLFSTVLVGIVNMLTTVIALLIIDKVGRKQLVWWGVGGMIVCLLMIGLYFLPSTNLPNWFMLTFFLLYVFCTAISISAVVFVLLSEMYPNRVRGLAMSIAGFALWIGTYLIGQLTPWMLETLTPAGTFFLFAFMCLPYLWIMYKYVPDTTGKTLEEIENYWKKR